MASQPWQRLGCSNRRPPPVQAVEAKLREACDPSTPMRDCQVEKVGDREWLTFTTSFMDGPYGPFGPREVWECVPRPPFSP